MASPAGFTLVVGPNKSHAVQLICLIILVLLRDTFGSYLGSSVNSWKFREDKTKCPNVRAIRDFDISQFLGSWYVVQYYASSEEAISYKCMRAELSLQPESAEVTMNFTYSFTDDPLNEQLLGNITWSIPSADTPAHWIHAEVPYEGVYNTYVLDTDYKTWALLMHCAEKSQSPRYLSSFVMSRGLALTSNVVSYLREKLPRYDIDLEYMFSMDQENCTSTEVLGSAFLPPSIVSAAAMSKRGDREHYATRRHPLKRRHKKT